MAEPNDFTPKQVGLSRYITTIEARKLAREHFRKQLRAKYVGQAYTPRGQMAPIFPPEMDKEADRLVSMTKDEDLMRLAIQSLMPGLMEGGPTEINVKLAKQVLGDERALELARAVHNYTVEVQKQEASAKSWQGIVATPNQPSPESDVFRAPTTTVGAIAAETKGSPLEKYAQTIYDMGVAYGVDPAVFLGIVKGENDYGRDSNSAANTNFNWASISNAAYGGQAVQGSRWGKYPTPEAGIEAFYKLLTKEYLPNGQTTLDSIWWGKNGSSTVTGQHAYAPASENDTGSIDRVKATMGRVAAQGQPSGLGDQITEPPTRFLADIIGQKDPWAQYEEAVNQLAMMPPEKKYAQDEDGRPMLDGSGSNYLLSPEAMRLQELAGKALDMARYGPKATGQNDIDAWVEGFKKYTGRNPNEQELLQKFGVGAGGADPTAAGNLEMRRKEFEYGQGQDALTRQDALQKERNAIMKAKAEAENWLAQLEGTAQDRYSTAASWGIFPKGQPTPTAPSFPGLPGLDLNNYRVAAPDFYGPAKTARERIAAQLAGMKAGE